ncbi:hypothetical protein PENTCL1PPCAC_17938, partial [Pristionchus entomophagus]
RRRRKSTKERAILSRPISSMNSFSIQKSQMGTTIHNQGIPKHLSPEQAVSAPHSQEAAHPSSEAKTDSVIECVIRGGSTPFIHSTVNTKASNYLENESKRFDDIFMWYVKGSDPNASIAPKFKNGRKRATKVSEEIGMDPELKKMLWDGLENGNMHKQHANTNVKVEEKVVMGGVNPLKKMEMMTNSPVFEMTKMNSLVDNKVSRLENDASVPSSSPSSSTTNSSSTSLPPPPSNFPSLVSPFQHQFISHYPMQNILPNSQPSFSPQFASPTFIPPNHPSSFHPAYQYPRPSNFPYSLPQQYS